MPYFKCANEECNTIIHLKPAIHIDKFNEEIKNKDVYCFPCFKKLKVE